MANSKPRAANEFKRYLPTLRNNDRKALIVLSVLAVGLMFTLLRPAIPPLEPIPAYVVKIDLNHANSESLLQLPGIGPVLAQRIVEYRDEHGPFQSVDQLKLVKGIGPVLTGKLRSLLEVKP